MRVQLEEKGQFGGASSPIKEEIIVLRQVASGEIPTAIFFPCGY